MRNAPRNNSACISALGSGYIFFNNNGEMMKPTIERTAIAIALLFISLKLAFNLAKRR